MKNLLVAVFILMPSIVHGTPNSTELLAEVNPNKAQRLTEYNSVFLQDALYFSKRHRIVKANTKLLLEGGDFTITPFDDLIPMHIKQEHLQRLVDKVRVKATIQPQNQSPFGNYEYNYSFPISLLAWDLDESGNALLSIENRFKHSPHWEIDEFSRPTLTTPPDGVAAVAGPPPGSLEDIQRHKKIKKLKKHQFYSVRTTFSSLDGKKYVLKPLKYTPKYSVIYEIDPTKLFRTRIDNFSGSPDTRSDDEKLQSSLREAFKKNLPKEVGKAVKGEIK